MEKLLELSKEKTPSIYPSFPINTQLTTLNQTNGHQQQPSYQI